MTGRKALILGSMGELGEDSQAEHLNVIKHIDSISPDFVILVGEEFGKALKTAGGRPWKWFASSTEAADALKAEPIEGFTVLVKGSRSTRMENVLPTL
jgi:UDP-N-acetylmuramoyl-tripeptide--D-alanyl-D-alanine ligase